MNKENFRATAEALRKKNYDRHWSRYGKIRTQMDVLIAIEKRLANIEDLLQEMLNRGDFGK